MLNNDRRQSRIIIRLWREENNYFEGRVQIAFN